MRSRTFTRLFPIRVVAAHGNEAAKSPRDAAPRRLLLQWHLSERCNLRCAHCYQDDHRAQGENLAAWLGIVERVRDFCAAFPDTANAARIPCQITLTGGEPFAHPEFPALLEHLSGMREAFSVAILSNGTLIDDVMARRLAGWAPRFVQVSIDGAPSTHDALRGAGNHAAVVAAIERMVGAGVRVFVSFTAHRGNYREFPDVARLGRRLGVAKVWTDRLIPQGQGGRLEGLGPDETRDFIERLRLARLEVDTVDSGRGATEIALHRALQFLAGGPAYRCTAGDTLLTVMPDGTLYPCRRMPIAIGNLHDTPLTTLYESPLLRGLRDPDRIARGCENCVYERLCRGGLRCLAHAVHGTTDVADPGCWLADR